MYITEGSLMDSVAISASLFCIVVSSVLTGTALPFGLAMMGIDPANAGTSIQVLPYACLLTEWLEPFLVNVGKCQARCGVPLGMLPLKISLHNGRKLRLSAGANRLLT